MTRFPYTATVVFTAYVLTGAWTWMRYSYALEVDEGTLPTSPGDSSWDFWDRRYVRVRPRRPDRAAYVGRVDAACNSGRYRRPPATKSEQIRLALEWLTRCAEPDRVKVFREAGRLTVESVVGLGFAVVGCVVFAVAVVGGYWAPR